MRVPALPKLRPLPLSWANLTGLPIHLWDERLTTRDAHEILYKAGHERQKHRKVVDQVAATLILQSFLDDRQGSGVRGQGSEIQSRVQKPDH